MLLGGSGMVLGAFFTLGLWLDPSRKVLSCTPASASAALPLCQTLSGALGCAGSPQLVQMWQRWGFS